MTASPRRRRTGLTLALLAFAQLIIALDYNIVYVALPEIGGDLGFSGQTLQWVVSAYAVTFGGFLLLGGRAADLAGRRRMFVFALVLYGLSSLVGGLAPDQGLLVAARAVQGLGGAFLFPATLSLVNTSFTEGPERNRALAVWSAAGGSGLAIGSLLGGVLTQAFGWSAVFFVNVPLAAVVAGLAFVLIEPDGARRRGRTFDIPGALAATLGITLIVLALVQGPDWGWGSVSTVGSIAGGAVVLAVFAVIETRSADPLMPLGMFGNRSLTAAMGVTLLFGSSFGAIFYLFTLYLHQILRFDALSTGLGFLPFAVAIAAGTQLGERLVTKVSTRTSLLAGFLVGAVGMVLSAFALATDGSYALLLPGIVITGLAQGVVWTSMWIASATGVAPERQGVASGMASTTNQVGVTLGLAIMVLIADHGASGLTGSALAHQTVHGLRIAYLTAAAIALAGGALALTFSRRRTAAVSDESAAERPVRVTAD
jgi:EmrB/QacA subfamily drug resistance transporter